MRTTKQLLDDVRRQLMLPETATLGLQNTDLLSAADQEMQSRILPLILSVNEEYNVQVIDVPIIQGQTQYRTPVRSAGSKLRDIRYLLGSTLIPLPMVNVENLQYWNTLAGGAAQGFYMAAASVNIVPKPTSGVLRMRYYAQHNKYVYWDGVDSTTAAKIQSVVYSQTVTPKDTITSGLPVAFMGSVTVNQKYDVISQAQPYEHLTLSANCTAADYVGYSITLVAPSVASTQTCVTMSPNIQADDIICKAGESPIVQLPDEVYPLLVTRVCIQTLLQLGDMERASAMEGIYKRQSEDFIKMFSPRSDGTPHKMNGFFQTVGTRPWFGYR